MFPPKVLFAEVIRVPGLIDELQTHLQVSVAGPTNFVAILQQPANGVPHVCHPEKGR